DKLITEDKIHTDSKLTAEILADRMMVSRKKLYLLLKDCKNISFSDYINGNRIDYAEKLITNEKYINISILEISEMAGFNSIGTFNKFFKAKYNSTPAKYRDANMLHS
ncbi:MAG: helix-turn-helix transcriptional regulator, partial [Rikenellaceae bacterium]